MNKRNIIIGIVALIALWAIVFFGLNLFINEQDDADVENVVLPTMRPTRTDVPVLRAPTDTPTPENIPEDATAPPTAEIIPSETPTERPTAAFTFSPLELERFQSQQAEDFVEAMKSEATLEIPFIEEDGAYPIRLVIEDLGILAPVLAVQTDEDFNITTPKDEVGYYALTPKIGAGGNSVLVGHVYPGRVFNNLLDAEKGQIVKVTDERFREHYYEITEIIRFPFEIGNEEDRELGFSYVYDNNEERITLVTCYPEFDWTHRFVVRAVPIDSPDGADIDADEDSDADSENDEED